MGVPMEKQPKIKYQEYAQLDGTKKHLVQSVGDGSIITRFDKTEIPQKATDVVCPHFLELKWAYGCPFNCAWCFLKGTLRFLDTKTKPVVKDYCKIRKHVLSLFENDGNSCELLNTGELADSLMTEHSEEPFSKFIVPLFEKQKRHKVLFLTKSTETKNLERIESHNQTIISFSLNAPAVSNTWEIAPPVNERILAAKKLSKCGYDVRVRIDPIVPIEKWQKDYFELIDDLFNSFIPERITFGSLRGLQSTINNAIDKTWVPYLTEKSNWGKKIAFKLRFELYKSIFDYLKDNFDYTKVALCKETVEMWNMLALDYTKINCNCLF
jgi:spore photoproduct lyase